MTNDKANMIIDVFKTLEDLKNCGEIQYINYKWDKKNNIFDITMIPKQTIQHINVCFTVTPSGATFQ